jgi:hypothetical protein
MSIKLSRSERFLRGAQMNTKPKKKKKNYKRQSLSRLFLFIFVDCRKLRKKRNFHPEKNKSLNQQKKDLFFWNFFEIYESSPALNEDESQSQKLNVEK